MNPGLYLIFPPLMPAPHYPRQLPRSPPLMSGSRELFIYSSNRVAVWAAARGRSAKSGKQNSCFLSSLRLPPGGACECRIHFRAFLQSPGVYIYFSSPFLVLVLGTPVTGGPLRNNRSGSRVTEGVDTGNPVLGGFPPRENGLAGGGLRTAQHTCNGP